MVGVRTHDRGPRRESTSNPASASAAFLDSLAHYVDHVSLDLRTVGVIGFPMVEPMLVGAFELFWTQAGHDDRQGVRFDVGQCNRQNDVGHQISPLSGRQFGLDLLHGPGTDAQLGCDLANTGVAAKAKWIGTVEAIDADAAIREAAKLYNIQDTKKLLAVQR